MKNLLGILLVLGCVFSQDVLAQFEGVISFNREKIETTKYKFTIKGDKIRVDDYGKDGKLMGVELIDVKEGKVIAMSPERKLYYDATTKAPAPVKPEITKTTNKKTVAGYKCTEWIAKMPLEDTEISYWVTDKSAGFTFFDDMLITLNRKDKFAKYFMAIPENDDVFPIEGIEKSSDGTVRVRLVATKVEAKAVDDNLFVIPADYQEFKR